MFPSTRQLMATTSTTYIDENDSNKSPQDDDLDTLSVTSVTLSEYNVPLGEADDMEEPLLGGTLSKEPAPKMGGLHILATSIGLLGVSSGLASGVFTVRSSYHQSDSGSLDVLAAQAFGFLSIACFIIATPMMFYSASSQQKHNQGRQCILNLYTCAWITYGISLIFLLGSMLSPAFSMTRKPIEMHDESPLNLSLSLCTALFNILPFILYDGTCRVEAAARKYYCDERSGLGGETLPLHECITPT